MAIPNYDPISKSIRIERMIGNEISKKLEEEDPKYAKETRATLTARLEITLSERDNYRTSYNNTRRELMATQDKLQELEHNVVDFTGVNKRLKVIFRETKTPFKPVKGGPELADALEALWKSVKVIDEGGSLLLEGTTQSVPEVQGEGQGQV
jgi:ABC-type transport system involved in cytochrome bd biosynthesis fused ATPase/permease subunit